MSDASMQTAATVDNLDKKNSKNDKKIVGNISMCILDTFKDMIPIPPKGDFRYELRGVHLGKGVSQKGRQKMTYIELVFFGRKKRRTLGQTFSMYQRQSEGSIYLRVCRRNIIRNGLVEKPCIFLRNCTHSKVFPHRCITRAFKRDTDGQITRRVYVMVV